MSLPLNAKASSLGVLRQLDTAANSAQKSMERLSSGLRINRAGDDAAGLSIAESLRADTRVYQQAVRNVNDGISLVSITQGAVTEMLSINARLSELAEQSANGVYSQNQRQALDDEFQALIKERVRIAETTEFNGLRPLMQAEPTTIQAGYGLEEVISVRTSLPQGLVGDGTFAKSGTFSINSGVATAIMKAADIDGDGNVDIVSRLGAGYSVSLGNGDGTVSFSETIAPIGAIPFLLRDVNGDGLADLLNVRSSPGNYRLELRRADGAGGFEAASVIESGDIGSFNSGQLFGSEEPDYALIINQSDPDPTLLRVYGNYGDGSSPGWIFQSDLRWSSAQEPVIADLNNDGFADIIVPFFGLNGLTVYLNEGNGGFINDGLEEIGLGSAYYRITTADINNDGNLDILASSASVANGSYTLLGNGDGSFRTGQSFAFYPSFSIKSDDLNKDGNSDIVIFNQVTQEYETYFGDGTGDFSLVNSFEPGSQVRYHELADMNNDGISDIVSGSGEIFLANTVEATPTYDLSLDVLTQTSARSALDELKSDTASLTQLLGALGAGESKLQIAARNLSTRTTELQAAESRIRDTDIAEESAALAAATIRKQVGVKMLSQMQIDRNLVLKLLENL